MRFVLGIDIGGTNLVVGCVAEDGSALHALGTEPTHAEAGASDVVDRMVALAQRAIAQLGRRSRTRRSSVWASAPPGRSTPRAASCCSRPISAGSTCRSARSSATGSASPRSWTTTPTAPCSANGGSAPRGARKHAIGITIGTGIGGGLILDGKLYHGASDVAGEIGHATIDTEGRRCKCGNYGCLEAYASGPNIALRAMEAIEAGAETRLPSYVGGDIARITAQTVYEAAHDGDELALEVVNDTAKFLGVGVANLLNVFNPEVVVVCGGVTLAGDHLFVPLRRETARRAFKPAVAACRIVPGELVGTAGVYGAAKTFLDA